MDIFVGTCGFCEGMKKYFNDFETVEIQQTFYKILDEKILKKWRDLCPENFIFNFKVFQGISHPYSSPTWRRSNVNVEEIKNDVGFLKPTRIVFDYWNKMLKYADILKSRVLVIQMPEKFKDEENNWENAEKFFRKIERRDFEIGIELRGWKEERIKKFCKNFDLIDVCDINLRTPASQRKISYFRLHGSYENKKINYNHKYSDEELSQIMKNIKNLETTFIYFNNMFMCDDAKRFKSLVKSQMNPTG